MVDFHEQILSRLGEQQVIGGHPPDKPAHFFTLEQGVLTLISWETSFRDEQLLDEPRDHLGKPFADAQYRALWANFIGRHLALSVVT